MTVRTASLVLVIKVVRVVGQRYQKMTIHGMVNRNNDPWYTRWFGIEGPNKTNDEEQVEMAV
jgi:hypothetical protein